MEGKQLTILLWKPSIQESYAGAIPLLTKEQHLPYDRPKLSKNLAVKAEQISLR